MTEPLYFSFSMRTTPCSNSTHRKPQIMLASSPKHTYRLQVMILAILATRMHLELWHADQRRHYYDSDDIMITPLPESNISPT